MQKPDSKRSVFPPTSEEYIEWTVDQLKLECTGRKLSVFKNTKKDDRVKPTTSPRCTMLPSSKQCGRMSTDLSLKQKPETKLLVSFGIMGLLPWGYIGHISTSLV
ncbi:hypothetical protein GQ600_24718 [Phytophthora cactorum]|nr:hypothetical protein GQ600_10738 [Phytophthora cactorum]KAF1784855.1 hypothetical protein GQ600_24718 [Phytophthora cactorum]